MRDGDIKSIYTIKDVMAVIVSFNCDEVIIQNVESLKNQVAEIVIMDNNSSSYSIEILNKLKEMNNCNVILHDSNEGISKRLNQTIKLAKEKGFKLLLTMDQDTVLAKDCVKSMVDVINHDNTLGAVGPKRCNEKEGKEYCYKDYLITSGNLLRLDIFDEQLRYDENLFVDMVDIDMSLALRSINYKLAISNKANMKHKVGLPEERKFGKLVYRYYSHSPQRFYSIYHNLVYIEKKYFKKYPGFCLKLVVSLMIDYFKIALENEHREKYANANKGIYDGVIAKQ